MHPSDDLTVRLACLADIPTLANWDNKQHVKAATSNDGTAGFDLDWEKELAPRTDGTEFLIAEVNGHPIGAMQIIDPATERTHYWGAIANNLRALDIWIGEEDYLSQGYGTRMMCYAINRCFADSRVIAVLIDPLSNNTKSHRFYERLGFEFVERRQFDDLTDCFVYRLERDAWEARNDAAGTATIVADQP